MTNAPDQSADSDDKITVTYWVAWEEDGSGAADDTATVDTDVTFTGGSATATDITVTALEPSVTVTKTVDIEDGDAGDTATYTLTVNNAGTGPAYDLVLTESLNDGYVSLATPNTVTT